jgi:hypothetical protein
MNFIDRVHHQFDSRILFKGALLNINGETYDCQVKKVGSQYHFTSEGRELCDPMWEYYIEPSGPYVPADMFQLKMVSACDGDATLICRSCSRVQQRTTKTISDKYGDEETSPHPHH